MKLPLHTDTPVMDDSLAVNTYVLLDDFIKNTREHSLLLRSLDLNHLQSMVQAASI